MFEATTNEYNVIVLFENITLKVIQRIGNKFFQLT